MAEGVDQSFLLRRFCADLGLPMPRPLTQADRLTLARAALRSVAGLIEDGRYRLARAMVDDLALHLERLREIGARAEGGSDD